ncbi:MAG: hypothetical protein M1481_04050 [Candidatus Thermoplasmatota archaeon]|jgi:hypothetical protein|nr:hypothetical protein [Candidatus Thermoplasmatota archaeon]MCL5963201.1 hypothetical protein [Candidatus Thermoplasmatota archaeon]
MAADIRIKVVGTKKNPLEGAKVTAINHSAWDSSKKRYGPVKTDSNGEALFEKMDTGIFGGDFYQFKVEYTKDGVTFFDDKYLNINSNATILVKLNIEQLPEKIDKKLSELEEKIYGNMGQFIIMNTSNKSDLEDLKKIVEDLNKKIIQLEQQLQKK